MAKRKGKSRKRIKDWDQRLDPGGEVEDRAPRSQKVTERAVKLPPSRLEAPRENLDERPKADGMVVGMYARGAFVRTAAGAEPLLCGIAKTFRAPETSSPLAVGDEVTVALTSDQTHGREEIDRDRADGMIIARKPRRTVLARPQPRSRKRRDDYGEETFEKVIAANMDQLMIVLATRQPAMNHGLIDRFLIVAERGELRPLLVVNKIDLAGPDPEIIEPVRDLGVEIVETSAATGTGLESLQEHLKGAESVLAGPSGVGKTSLINRLIPEAEGDTRSVRAKDQRGRHTTSASIVYDLPCGGVIIDTPGVRELAISIEPAELPWYFPEFEAFASGCKFNDCTHTHEPNCAVQEAVDRGEILPRRFESYLRILDSLSENW